MTQTSTPSERLLRRGLTLPPMPRANGAYVTWLREGDRLTTSGQLSREGDSVIKGPIQAGDDLGEARRAAEVCLLRALSVAQTAVGDLDRVEGVTRLRGYVASGAGFEQHSQVLDAASDLILDLFGEPGRHIRTAVGVSSLPSGGLVEIEVTFRLAPGTPGG